MNSTKKEHIPQQDLSLIKEIKNNFKLVNDLWDEYYKVQVNGLDLALEVHKRLQQVEFLFDQIKKLEERSRVNANLMINEVMVNKTQAPQKLLKQDQQTSFKIELYTESLYYLAFRLVSIMSKVTGNRDIKHKSQGITIVRNKLIEHSENRDSKITILSFGHVGPYGPVIKSARYEHQVNVFKDLGLYKNIYEMLIVIKKSITIEK